MMTQWRYKGINSITRYVIAIEFASRFTPETFKAMSGLHGQVRKVLPRKVEQQEITFPLGAGGPAAPALGSLGGLVFDRIKPDGTVERQLAVTPQAIVFTDSSYTRWHEFWPGAKTLMMPALLEAAKLSALSALSLEVVNRFTWAGLETHIESNFLIREATTYIAKNLVSHKGLSHSFHGFAFPSVDPVGRRVDNINLALLDRQEDGTPADLALSYKIQFERPISSFDDLPGGTLDGFMDKKFDDLHVANNIRFKEIVVPDIWSNMEGLSV